MTSEEQAKEMRDARDPNPHRINDWYPSNVDVEYRAYQSRIDNYAVLDLDVRDNSVLKQHTSRTFVIMSAEELVRLANRLYRVANVISPGVVEELGGIISNSKTNKSEVNLKRKITL